MYLKMEQGSKEEHMRKFNQLVLKIFEYVAKAANFDKSDFERFIENDEVWSSKCYIPRSGFYKKIQNLFDFSREERDRIYKAIQHDIEFDQNLENSNFVFQENALNKEQIHIIKELILYLYESPFREKKFSIQNQKFGYHEFKESLFERNVSCICPACLAMQTDLKVYGEVDHYFPKDHYPALIFHPGNLVVICGECNDLVVKGNKNASEMGNLTELYIPYLRNAEKEVDLKVRKVEEKGKDGEQIRATKMMMVPRVPDVNGLVDRRIHNFDSLYDLSNRWTSRMNSIIMYELKCLENEKWERKVIKQIHKEAKDRKKRADKNKTILLEAVTFSYLENEGRGSFLAEWKKRQTEREEMRNFWKFWR